MRIIRPALLALGWLAILIGLVWMGQGSGYFPYPASSFMIDQSVWIEYGLGLAVGGIVLVLLARAFRRRPAPHAVAPPLARPLPAPIADRTPVVLPEPASPVRVAPLHVRFGSDGDAVPYLGTGWANPNEAFTWSLGHEARVTVPAPPGSRLLRLVVRLRPLFSPGRLEEQRLLVYVDGHFAGSFVFAGPEMRTAVLDLVDDTASETTEISVVFRMPDATSPAALGLSADKQVLGFAFTSLTVGPADPALPDDALHPEAEMPRDVPLTLG